MHLPNLLAKITEVYETHGNIIIALDFDDTIYDWKSKGYDVEHVVNLVLQSQSRLNAKVILFTCREGEWLDFAVNYCGEKGISLYGVNENPDHPPTKSKPFYNIMLDDKACLPETCKVLEALLEIYT